MTDQFHRTQVGSQLLDLPIQAIGDDLAIALLITVDVPISVLHRAGAELGEQLIATTPDVVVTAATLGIPVASAVAPTLGHDEYVVLHKTPKIHLADGLTEELRSITTSGEQRLRLDPARRNLVSGRRVAFVDDVISTGGSAAAAVRLIRRAGGQVVAIGTLLTESSAWVETLGDDAELVLALGSIPVFRPDPTGGWTPERG